jgi:endonuclease/exonuclease/phosphatase family metal-dependent hydrolase
LAHRFSILTFNAWLLRTPWGMQISQDSEERLAALPAALAATQAEIICLQEVWDPSYRRQIVEEMRGFGYCYHSDPEPRAGGGFFPLTYFHEFFGHGLLTLSKFPLVGEEKQLRFRNITRADEFLVKKGAIAVEADLGDGNRVLVCNSHLGAVSYSQRQRAYKKSHLRSRLKQAQELNRWLGEIREDRSLFLAVDLNAHLYAEGLGEKSGPLARELKLLLEESGKGFALQEAMIELGLHVPVPQWTFHSANPYVSGGHFGHLPDQVTDYLFFAADDWQLRAGRLVFHAVPGASEEKPLSDHFGLLLAFEKK